MKLSPAFGRQLRSNPLPRIPGLIVTVARIYLYRDDQPRPREYFHDVDERIEPLGPWHRESFPTPGPKTLFMLYTDHSSLPELKPLHFHADAFGLDLNSSSITLFLKNGGYPPPRSDQEDAALVHALFDALRSFPEGWESHSFCWDKSKGETHEDFDSAAG